MKALVRLLACMLSTTLMLGGGSLCADEAAPTFKHRVTGLFSPDREQDLRGVLEQLPGITLQSLDYAHAEAVFQYDPAVVFKGTKPEDIAKRFDEKIRAASSNTFGIQPLYLVPHDQLKLVEIAVVGLDCKACSLAAYEAVAKIEGVTQASASFREGKVTALIDPARTNQAALEEALKKKQVSIPSTSKP
jgi:copper chaperone CopZ